MSCQIRRNNYREYKVLLQEAKKLEILFAEDVLLEEHFIESCSMLEDIEIYGSKISKAHDDILKRLLLHQKTIIKLELNCTIINSSFLSVLYQSNIQELYLTHLIFNQEIIDFLCNGITNSKIKTLDLSYNDFINNSCFEKLCSCLPKTSIKFLFLCCCHISTEGSFHLFQVIERTKIYYLDLFQNDIMDKGVECLCSLLPSTNIKFIDIGKNNLSDASCQYFANILHQTKLQHLWINDTEITKNGIESIYNVIRNTYLVNFQYPLRLMSRFQFVPLFYENRKKIRRYNQTVHFRNFLAIMEVKEIFYPDVFFIPELVDIILSFL